MREAIVQPAKRAAVALVAIALISLGPTAVFAPSVAAGAYGIPLTSDAARAYLVAAALRDVAMGSWLLALVALEASPRVVAVSLFAVALVALGDAATVVAHSGWHARSLGLHLAGFAGLLALGCWAASRHRDREAGRSRPPTRP